PTTATLRPPAAPPSPPGPSPAPPTPPAASAAPRGESPAPTPPTPLTPPAPAPSYAPEAAPSSIPRTPGARGNSSSRPARGLSRQETGSSPRERSIQASLQPMQVFTSSGLPASEVARMRGSAR